MFEKNNKGAESEWDPNSPYTNEEAFARDSQWILWGQTLGGYPTGMDDKIDKTNQNKENKIMCLVGRG